MRKRWSGIIGAAFLLTLLMTMTVWAERGWVQDDKGWKFDRGDGVFFTDQWFRFDDISHYFGADGYMRYDMWVAAPDGWVYLQSDGGAQNGGVTPDGYPVDYDGYWLDDNGKRIIVTDNEVKQWKEANRNLNKSYPSTWRDGETTEKQGEEQTTQGAVKESEAFSNLVYPVDILGGGFGRNFVGGISPYVAFRNNSGKDIKYVTLEMTPYNRVGDPVVCTIRGYSTTASRVTGPFSPDTGVGQGAYSLTSGLVLIFDGDTAHPYYYTSRTHKKTELDKVMYAKTFNHMPRWDCVWYNSDIYKIVITKAVIEYMDGSSDTLSPYVIMFHDDTFD